MIVASTRRTGSKIMTLGRTSPMRAVFRAGFAAAFAAAFLTISRSRRAPPTRHSRTATSPTARSSSKPRSSPMPARRPSRSRKSARMPTRPSPRTISATACRCSARSSPPHPNDATNWLRLARTIMQIRPATTTKRRRCSRTPPPPPTSPISAPPIATKKPTASRCSARVMANAQLWRPALDALRLSLELRETADVRAPI